MEKSIANLVHKGNPTALNVGYSAGEYDKVSILNNKVMSTLLELSSYNHCIKHEGRSMTGNVTYTRST